MGCTCLLQNVPCSTIAKKLFGMSSFMMCLLGVHEELLEFDWLHLIALLSFSDLTPRWSFFFVHRLLFQVTAFSKELSRVDPNGEPHYTLSEIFEGQVCLPPTNEAVTFGYFGTDSMYANPLLVKISMAAWQYYPECRLLAERFGLVVFGVFVRLTDSKQLLATCFQRFDIGFCASIVGACRFAQCCVWCLCDSRQQVGCLARESFSQGCYKTFGEKKLSEPCFSCCISGFVKKEQSILRIQF